MTIYSKFNIVYKLQKWMDSVAGQTFLNYAYSWGASVVILGTLFKLTHLSGANFFLFLGMGTEVFVFFISAFDRPFDKTTDGMQLETEHEIAAKVDDSQIASARQRMIHQGGGILQPVAPVYEEEYGSADYAVAMNQTEKRLKEAQQLSEQLPDNKDSAELKKTLNAISEIYKLQLQKASGQMMTIDNIDSELKTLCGNLDELNKIYARMIEAVKIK